MPFDSDRPDSFDTLLLVDQPIGGLTGGEEISGPWRLQRSSEDTRILMQQSQAPASPAAQARPVETQKPAAPQIPVIGETFAGKVVGVDETAVLIAIPGFGEDKAISVLKAEAIEGGRPERYRVGNAARVEVTGTRALKSGRTIVELKPGAKNR